MLLQASQTLWSNSRTINCHITLSVLITILITILLATLLAVPIALYPLSLPPRPLPFLAPISIPITTAVLGYLPSPLVSPPSQAAPPPSSSTYSSSSHSHHPKVSSVLPRPSPKPPSPAPPSPSSSTTISTVFAPQPPHNQTSRYHCYEPIMQRLITLKIEYKILLLAADAFKNLERPDLVISDEEYEELMGRIDEACKDVR